MLKSLLGVSAALGLLLATTTAFGHPHQPPSSHHDNYDRVGNPVEHSSSARSDRVKARHTESARHGARSAHSSAVTKRSERVTNCSEFNSCSGTSTKTHGASQVSKASNGSKRSTTDAYLQKVANLRLKALIESFFPGKGPMNGGNAFDP
jgi:hypothetical protein